MCYCVCAHASQLVPEARFDVSNTRYWPTHHFVTFLPLFLLLSPSASTHWNSERQTLKCWKSNSGYLGVKHSVVVVQDQVLSSPQSLLSPPHQKWKETLKYFKSSLWICPTEVGVSGKAFNPSTLEIIKHYRSEEPVEFFKMSSCRLLFPLPVCFSLSTQASLLSASSSTSFSLVPQPVFQPGLKMHPWF